jgi:hypothetical protein
MEDVDASPAEKLIRRAPWSKGKLVGAKPPLRPSPAGVDLPVAFDRLVSRPVEGALVALVHGLLPALLGNPAPEVESFAAVPGDSVKPTTLR